MAVQPQTPGSVGKGQGGLSCSLQGFSPFTNTPGQQRKGEMQGLRGKNMAFCSFLHGFQGSLKLGVEVNPFSALK